jgi:transposase
MNKDTMGKLIERAATMKSLQEKQITQVAASIQLGVSERQIRRLYKRYKKDGSEALIHKNIGKQSQRKLSSSIEAQAIEWLRQNGSDFGSTFAQEKLIEYLGINVSVGTIRTWRIKHGLHVSRSKKCKIYVRRQRKQFFGAMVQVDGSKHDWFEGRGEKCMLLTMIDDATGKIYSIFSPGESTKGLMTLFRQYIEKYGRPHVIYTDHGGAYKVNVGNAEGDKKTQLGRALDELGIKLIFANSPQAKGRVERNHGIHQDRLIKEMRLRGI